MHERILECTRECGHEHLALRVVAKRWPQPADKNARIGTDGCLGIALHLGEEAQEVVVQYTVTKLAPAVKVSSLRIERKQLSSHLIRQ